MTVRAKFKVQSVSEGSVKLSAVTDGSEENKTFFKYTPYGEIQMGMVNPQTAEQFVPGQEFYVDFTPAGALVQTSQISS